MDNIYGDDIRRNSNPTDSENLDFTVNDLINQIENRINILNSSVYLYGGMDDEWTSYDIISRMQYLHGLGKKKINLHINTDGGDVQEMFAIYDYIKSLNIPVNTLCRGKAISAGAMILISGTGGRFMSKNSNMLLHEIHLDLNGSTSQIKNETAFFNKKQKEFYKILEEHSKHDSEYWEEKLSKGDLLLSADECLTLGLIDKII